MSHHLLYGTESSIVYPPRSLGRSPLVTGLLTWGHDLVALTSWFWFPVGITCLLCESDGTGSQVPRLGTEAER